MSEKKPEVVYFPPHRTICPGCGKPSYSRSGEHPQCAVTRADAAFKARQLAHAQSKPSAPKRQPLPPKCQPLPPNVQALAAKRS
jgi:hypothetical protein